MLRIQEFEFMECQQEIRRAGNVPNFKYGATGCGEDFESALSDALQKVTMDGTDLDIDVTDLENRIRSGKPSVSLKSTHVAIRWNVAQ